MTSSRETVVSKENVIAYECSMLFTGGIEIIWDILNFHSFNILLCQ